jgi:hypothetical protein
LVPKPTKELHALKDLVNDHVLMTTRSPGSGVLLPEISLQTGTALNMQALGHQLRSEAKRKK